MNTGKQNLIEKWRQLIPGIECVPGCTECCSITPPFSDWEWKQTGIEGDLEMASPCRFLVDNKCTIYEHRPIICRLFGAVVDEPSLKCHSGCKYKRVLSKVVASEIMRSWVVLTIKSKCFSKEKFLESRQLLREFLASKYGVPIKNIETVMQGRMRHL